MADSGHVRDLEAELVAVGHSGGSLPSSGSTAVSVKDQFSDESASLGASRAVAARGVLTVSWH